MRTGDKIALAIALVLLAVIIWIVYQFVTHVPPGALDCTISWGREGCNTAEGVGSGLS